MVCTSPTLTTATMSTCGHRCSRVRNSYVVADATIVLSKSKLRNRAIILFANVRRQVSLAGGNGESQKQGVKALGMLCCQHPLCLNAALRKSPSETCAGQRLTARPCSRLFLRGPVRLPLALAFLSASGGGCFSRGLECRKSYHAVPLKYFCLDDSAHGRGREVQITQSKPKIITVRNAMLMRRRRMSPLDNVLRVGVRKEVQRK